MPLLSNTSKCKKIMMRQAIDIYLTCSSVYLARSSLIGMKIVPEAPKSIHSCVFTNIVLFSQIWLCCFNDTYSMAFNSFLTSRYPALVYVDVHLVFWNYFNNFQPTILKIKILTSKSLFMQLDRILQSCIACKMTLYLNIETDGINFFNMILHVL